MGRFLRYLPLIGASLCALLATVSVWVQRQVLDTDQWTETSSKLLEQKAIRDTVATFLVDELYQNVNVAHQLETALPGDTKRLAAPAAGALRSLAEDQAGRALAQPTVQTLWEQANRSAHAQLVSFLEGKGSTVSANQGQVSLDLRTLVRRVGERVGLQNLDQKLPQSAAEIEIVSSDQLDTAQDAVVVIRGLALTTSILALLLFALYIGLAGERRRQALREAGLSLIGVGIVVLAIRELGGRFVVDHLVNTASIKPAADQTWSIATELLASQAKALIVYGFVAIFGAFIAGPSRVATDIRRAVAPWADEPPIAYGFFALVVLAMLLWAPTEGTRRLVPALVLIALFAFGFEMLRRQIKREYPDAKDPDWRDLFDDFLGAIGSAGRRARSAMSDVGDELSIGRRGGGTDEEQRLGQLERLGRLKESGVLTQREFAAEKKRILGAGNGNRAAAGRKPAARRKPAAASAKRSSGRRAAASRK